MLEKSTVRTEALYDDEKTHRYSLKKIWDNSKPSAAIIMIAPSEKANEICSDMTTMYTLNNVYKQGFGSVDILNLHSKLDSEEPTSDPDNDDWIVQICKKADKVILAWGKGQNTVSAPIRILAVIKLLQPYKDKLLWKQSSILLEVSLLWCLISFSFLLPTNLHKIWCYHFTAPIPRTDL